jgi:hypothetical protein
MYVQKLYDKSKYTFALKKINKHFIDIQKAPPQYKSPHNKSCMGFLGLSLSKQPQPPLFPSPHSAYYTHPFLLRTCQS